MARGTQDEDAKVEGAEPTAKGKAVAEDGTTAKGLDREALAKASGKPRSVNERATRLAADSDDTPRTLLDEDVAMPGYVAPGDGPFDTVDPTEHATSVSPDKGAAAAKGFGVVNAVLPIADPSGREQVAARAAQARGEGQDRMERYTVTGPDGQPVQVERNMDTGESRRV